MALVDFVIKSFTGLNKSFFCEDDQPYKRRIVIKDNLFMLPSFYNHRMINVTLETWKFQVDEDKILGDAILSSLIFNNISASSIDYYLSQLSITDYDSFNPNFFQINGIQITYLGYSTKKKNYIISYSSKRNNMKKPSTDNDKLICLKFLILIMNEVNPNFLNIGNYSSLVRWGFDKIKNSDSFSFVEFSPPGW